MSIYPPPTQTGIIFDLDNWEQIVDTVGGLPISFLNERYLKYTTALGDETFSNTINTGYSDVDGSTICNNFDTYSSPATTSLFDTTDDASQVIRLGVGQTAGGTINLGKQYDGLATYGTNQVANWTSIGRQIVGESRPELNLTDATSDSYIGHNQTTGELFLGTESTRTGTILFGSNASGNVTHNIGGGTSAVRLAGDVKIINTTTTLSQTNGTVYMTDNYTLTYSEVVNELNIINGSTGVRSLYLPSTIRDFTFWVTTLTRSLYIRRTGLLLIDFLCDSTTDLFVSAGTTVCINACVGSNSFNLIYTSGEAYKPIILYPNLTSFAPSSIQSGYIFYAGSVNATKASGVTTATSLNLTSTALPKGIYYINIYGYITITAIGLAPTLGLKRPFFVGCVSTTLNQSTVVNNIADSYYNYDFYTPPVVGTVFGQIGVSGYYNNSTTGTILYGYGRIDAGGVNVNTAYRVNLEMSIRRIY